MKDSQLAGELQRRIEEAFRAVPFARLLGIELVEIERGAATVALQVRDELKQNNGVVHGGVIASLVDTAAAFVVLPFLAEGETTTTVDLTIHYLRPLSRGKVTATARVVRAGRRILTISAEVLDERQAIAATALATFIRLKTDDGR